LIEESEELTCQAAETTYEDLSSALGELRVGLIHGRMKAAEKAEVMARVSRPVSCNCWWPPR
jgi:ATP-dependent DNA helicase RecG